MVMDIERAETAFRAVDIEVAETIGATALKSEHLATVTVLEPAAPRPKRQRRANSALNTRNYEYDGSTREDRFDTDTISIYLVDIGQFNLMTKEEESALGQRVQDGLKAAAELKAGVHKNGTSAQRNAIRKERDGLDAKAEFTERNLRLVVNTANRYRGITRHLNFEDLVQEGNIGLMRAVDKFDHRKGFKFSTYATFWIRQAIGNAIAESDSTIKVAVNRQDAFHSFRKSQENLLEELGRIPTVEETAAYMGKTAAWVEQVLIDMSIQDGVSLETPIGDERSDSELIDILPDRQDNTEDQVVLKSVYEGVWQALRSIDNEIDRSLVIGRYGLDGKGAKSFKELGEEFGMTYGNARDRIKNLLGGTLIENLLGQGLNGQSID